MRDVPAVTDFEMIAECYQFAEAPRADEEGAVYWSDLLGGGYYRRRPGAEIETLVADRIWIGGAVLDQGGGLVIGGRGGIMLVERAGTRPLLDSIAGKPIVAVNDIEGDGRGGLFGGTVDFVSILETGETPAPGSFFHLAVNGDVTVLRDDVAVSNGIGFSPDGSRLYHSETTVGIWEWRIDEDGKAGSPRLLIEADDSDGLAVDAEGGIWVAFFKQALVRRFRPDGTAERALSLPFPHVTSLAFGGADRRDLYITTGGNADHPGKGGVIRIRSEMAGLPEARTAFGRR